MTFYQVLANDDGIDEKKKDEKNGYINEEEVFVERISQLNGRNDTTKDSIWKKKIFVS